MSKKNKNKDRYVCCVTGYYDPEDDDKNIVRMTAIITDLKTDNIEDSLETFCDEDLDVFSDKIMNMCKKYDAMIVCCDELEPLERCKCEGCNGYIDSFITKKDWQNIKYSKN
jgi:hypothetical protein